MAIINRDLDVSQRRYALESTLSALATGVTTVLGVVPHDGLVNSCYATAFGLSGTPAGFFSLYRFGSAGFTAIGLGASIVTPAFGTSGVIAATLIAGVTCLRGDLLVHRSSGTDSATERTVLGAVIQASGDYLKFPGT